jgi:ABC-type cobalamin/Fe3+-siderophores transport system ATPase subunit
LAGGICTILIAPNGAGKSRELRRISKGTTKHLQFLNPERHARAASFSLVSQSVDRPSISNRVSSLLETPLVLGGLSIHKARDHSQEVLNRFGFGRLYQRTLMGLSGGEDQVVHLLAGISQNRPGLIVDDPFGMLDIARSAEIQQLLKRYGEGKETGYPREFILGIPDSDVALISELKDSIHDNLSIQVPARQEGREALSEFVEAVFQQCAPLTDESHVVFDNVRLTLKEKRRERELARLSSVMTSGQVYVLTGENGCGKSLLLNAIVGKLPRIARLATGSILLDGFRHTGRRKRFARVCVFVPQHCSRLLTATTPWQGLTEILIDHHADLIAGAQGLLESQLLWADRQTTDASVGQTRFVTLFLAAISALIRPEIKWFIADEPDAYLDSFRLIQLAELLSCLAAAGKGVLITSHRKEHYKGVTEIPLILEDRDLEA